LKYSTERANANELGGTIETSERMGAFVEILRIDHGAICVREDF
jgi:hypothetical protein